VTGDKRPNRRDQARKTRRAIIDAARTEFMDGGYHGATIASIARRAGVAPQTIYFVFHTKAELVSAVIDDAVLGPDDPTVPQQSEWWAEVVAAPTAGAALEHFIRGAAPLLDRAAEVSEIVRAAALTDDEVRDVYGYHADLQERAYRGVIDIVITKGELRDGFTAEIATDALLTLCGDAIWVQLRKERGWPLDRTVGWLVDTVPAALLAQPSR